MCNEVSAQHFLYDYLFIRNIYSIHFGSTEVRRTESTAIWFHDSTLTSNLQRVMQNKLYAMFRHVKTFIKKEDFVDYLDNDFNEPILYFIISGNYAEELCHHITSKSARYKLYELDTNLHQSIRKSSNTWITFSNEKELFKALEENLTRWKIVINDTKDTSNAETHADVYKTFLPPLSILDSLPTPPSLHFFDKDSSTCLLFQLLTKTLIEANYGDNELLTMCAFSRENYSENISQMTYINTFQDEYHVDKAIQFYTQYSFLFMLLTKVFQCEDTVGIYQFRRYIADLHNSLARKYRTPDNNIILYRGKKVPLIILQQLKDLKQRSRENDAHISINGFLSMTKNRQIANMFAGINEIRDGYESTLFKFKINKQMTTTTVYTDITEISSFPPEMETLFSMGSVWKLLKIEHDDGVWLIELELSNRFDDHFNEFQTKFLNTHPFLREPSNAYYMFLLANILYELGRYIQSGELYHELLDEKCLSNDFQCLIHLNLAKMQDERGHFRQAREHLEKALKLRSSNYESTTIDSRVTIMHQIGLICQKQSKYQQAHTLFQAALNESGSNQAKAIVHNSIGFLGMVRGHITEETHEHLTKAVALIGNHGYEHRFRKDLEKMEELLHKKYQKQQN